MKKFVSLLFCTAILSGCGVITTSDGDRVGVVSKLSRKGIIFKTWEGELVMGGINQFSSPQANVFKFSVIDSSVVRDLQQSMDEQKPVKITYRQVLFPLIFVQKTDYQATHVTSKQ